MKRYIVDSAAIRQNLETLKKRAGKAQLFAVVKGNGYGLGLVPLAAICRDAGVTTFCVTEVPDAKQLRDAGFTQNILMIRPTCDVDEVHALVDLDVILTVSSQDDAAVLNGIATQRKQKIKAHIEIDTGMGRYGFLPSEIDKLIHIYSYMDGLDLCGIYTHFHSAFCNKKATDLQAVAFRSVIRQLQEKGFEVGLCHCCNSAGLLRFPNYAMDAVRVGSAILGRLSFKGSYNLKRVGVLEASVDELRWLPRGHSCGYGAGWKAKKPTRIAVLPIGWYNGFGCQMGNDLTRRKDSLRGIFSNLKHLIFGRKGYSVLLGGKRCRVLGHIGMLHTVVDVTNVNCKLGDKAIFDVNPLMLKGVDVIFQ